MPRPSKQFCVAIVLDRSRAETIDLLDGILGQARRRGWRLGDASTVDFADGVIRDLACSTASLRSPAGVPQVTVSADPFGDADVRPDAFAVGRMAAEHFLDRGFHRFAYFGEQGAGYNGFGGLAAHHGHTAGASTDPAEVLAWPRPVCCLAQSDADAVALLAAAKDAGRSVPEDVAVLGVGNDTLQCELVTPPLSSLDVGYRQLGTRAAARLHRLLFGRSVDVFEHLPPLGVVTRASTDTLAIDDADVVAAIRFIRENANFPLRVGDVLRAVDVDRRTLERRFQKSLGRSPAEVMRRTRVERAAKLLRTTDLSMTDIAKASGFRLPQHMAAAFKLTHGQTPSDYRETIVGAGLDFAARFL